MAISEYQMTLGVVRGGSAIPLAVGPVKHVYWVRLRRYELPLSYQCLYLEDLIGVTQDDSYKKYG